MFAFLKHLFKLQFLFILFGMLAGIYYPQLLDQFKSFLHNYTLGSDEIALKFGESTNELLYTKESLSKFDGSTEDTPVYLSILGSVFDVSKGRKHYGAGCSYNFFAGRDASKAFFTGDFEDYTEDSDDVLSLEPKDLPSLADWKEFYDKDYVYKGKLIGRFFDDTGAKTQYHHKFDALVELAKEKKAEEKKLKEIYPPCNIEWTAERGSRVWCTDVSGGVKRDYVGVPRKYFEPGQESWRCACIRENDLNSNLLKPYDECDSKSDTCFYNVN